MTHFSIAVLPGDGIGPEVIAEAERVLEAVSERFEVKLALSRYAIEAVLRADPSRLRRPKSGSFAPAALRMTSSLRKMGKNNSIRCKIRRQAAEE